VDSKLGVGSTFWFNVRLGLGGEQSEIVHRTSHEVTPVMLKAINGARILLVENNLFNQEVACEFLKNADALVSIAQNGAEALDLLRLESFDCVLMDIQMPVMDGFEATKQIRKDTSLAHLPVIAMTADAWNEDREHCLEIGMDDFISKPFKPDALYRMLEKWLMSPRSGSAVIPDEEGVVVDLAELSELVGGERQKMRDLAQKFLLLAQSGMGDIDAALRRNDLAALSALGHHHKGPARMIGAIEFAKLCQALEKQAQNGDGKRLGDIVEKMRALLQLIDAYLEQELA
jgi:CheY-like chemotaxis protein